MSMFAHLHVHSCYSPNWGIHTPDELCRCARDAGMRHLALTDRNGLYGIPHFLRAAREHNISPLVGSELVHGSMRAVALAMNRTGYANLCHLISKLHCDPAFDLAAGLLHHRQGMVIFSDHPQLLQTLRPSCKGELYVELSPGHQMHAALRLARQLDLPPVATCRSVLLADDDFDLHRVLRAIAGNTTLDQLDPATHATRSDRFLNPEQVQERFPHCPDAIANCARITDRCAADWDNPATIFPRYRDMRDSRALFHLQRRTLEGAKRRYGQVDTAIRDRLRKEFAIIRDKQFAHYFLVVAELVRHSPRTCGRGSAAASLVAYSLGITHVDPLRFNLFFERFLNPGRLDPPDIDVDFPWDERDRVLDAAFARYGAQRAAMVANQIGYKGRSALREVAKVFGVPALEIKQVTRRISGYWRASQALAAINEHPLFRGETLQGDWPLILRIAARMRRQLRHLGLHCGGLVIVPDEIRNHVPIEVSAKGLPVIQWEKDQAEMAGLVKIDLLGNRSLAVIRDALAAIEHNTGNRIDYGAWRPLDDPTTRQLLCRGASMGCFYIESPATRQLLRRMFGPETGAGISPDALFEHLVMASSIIRPAANRFILEFVARMRGKPWRSLHPLLDPVLAETYGIAVYQEQITQMAMALAGFDPYHGDQLRKIISYKHKGKNLEDYRQRFYAGGRDNGLGTPLLDEVWEQILSFGGYSFCKPHSASYALVSCKSAWLKANYPAEFMAAVISNQGGYYSASAYLSECRRLGLVITPPDINASDWQYTGRGREVRIGLMQVAGLRQNDLQELIRERERQGPFTSFADVLVRTSLPTDQVRTLIKSGCFDRIEAPERRPELLWQALAAERQHTSGSLNFGVTVDSGPTLPPLDERERHRQEQEVLGFVPTEHPLAPWRDAILAAGAIPAREIPRRVGKRITLAGWWVTGKTVQTKHDQPMQFITFEDESAIYETTFFPAIYDRYCRQLGLPRPYLLKGKVEAEFDVPTVTVDWVGFLD